MYLFTFLNLHITFLYLHIKLPNSCLYLSYNLHINSFFMIHLRTNDTSKYIVFSYLSLSSCKIQRLAAVEKMDIFCKTAIWYGIVFTLCSSFQPLSCEIEPNLFDSQIS